MRIAIVVSDPASGILFYPVYTAVAVKELGHDVTAISWTSQVMQAGDLERHLSLNGIKIHMLPILRKSGSLSSILGSAVRRYDKVKCRQHNDFDIIISTGPYVTWQLCNHLQHDSHFVTIVNAMGSGRKGFWKPRVGAFMLNRYSNTVVALCHLEQHRLETLGVKSYKIRVIFNPMSNDSILAKAERFLEMGKAAFLSKLNLDPERKSIVCLASLLPHKRQDVLIQAFAKLACNYPEYDVVLAGEGSELPSCAKLAHALGIRSRVHFVGRLDNHQAIGLLACADVAANCSNADTFGYSMVEPLLLKKPTIVTRVGIGWELEQADVAEVVPPDDETAFTEGLKRVLQGSSKIEERLSRGKAFVIENFDVHKIARQLIAAATEK